jgi:hypothetical protein
MGNQSIKILNIMMKMNWIKRFKVFESNNIDKINYDIDYVRDTLLELEDLGFFVQVNLTPLTLAGKTDKPEFYIDIQKPDNWLQFYDDDYPLVNKYKDFIDLTISHALEYIEERGYKMYFPVEIYSTYTTEPTNFNFKNNPTNYQMIFTV